MRVRADLGGCLDNEERYGDHMDDGDDDDHEMMDEGVDDVGQPRDYSPGRRKKYQKPTNIIYVKVTLLRSHSFENVLQGLPADVTEAEVYGMIESLKDTFTIQAIRLGRDRVTGASRGFGFIVSSSRSASILRVDTSRGIQGISND